MAINLGSRPQTAGAANTAAPAATLEETVFNGIDLEKPGASTMQVAPLQENQMSTFTQTYKEKLRQMPEVEALTAEIHVDDPNTILVFGQGASQGISTISDSLLSTMKAVKAEEAGEMIVQLTKIMDKFDIKELEEAKAPSGLQKLFNRAKTSIETMFQKYENMGAEVDKVYVILKKYEMDIQNTNQNLKKMYDANIAYYQELEKYIVAGELGLKELDETLIPQFDQEAATGDQLAIANAQNLRQIREMLDQRIYDLRLAENIALQTIPMIQGIQYSNFNLTRKINSAFIITLPIFKQCLTQAVMLKRQELQAKSLKALDDKTNELLLRNAENMARQTTGIARMAGTSSIQMETLEKTWSTIMQGIEQTKQIEAENQVQRKANSTKLENMKAQMLTMKTHN